MKKQNAGKEARKRERERICRAEKAARIPRPLHRPMYPVWDLEKYILLRRLREALVRRIGNLVATAPEPLGENLLLPEANAIAAPPVCPICKLVITPEHYRYNVKTITYNRKPVLVHIICPNEPGYVFLREGSPGSGRFA
jgi:hypothetical protein